MREDDYLIFGPGDVDLAHSPLRHDLDVETCVLGAFNPGLTRLESGNLLMMVRVAEALRDPVFDGHVHMIGWTPAGYRLSRFPVADVDMGDPRQFALRGRSHPALGLTSLSWLLPVELSADGATIIRAHYDAAIAPRASYQQYGVEDPRISRIDGRWYMTTCSVSAARLCSTLYVSDDGLNYQLEGIVLDHQNKDMILFEGKVDDRFMALTRPLGDVYFVWDEKSPNAGGPSINLAVSPDALHWRPISGGGLHPLKASVMASKLGGGTPPILTDGGWMTIYHGVEHHENVGSYRSFWALLDRVDPAIVLRRDESTSLIEADPELTRSIAHLQYLPTNVVFSTGIVDGGDHYLVASGQADLACRMKRIPKSVFA